MEKRKTDDEYVGVPTTVIIERETDRLLKLTVKEPDISQSAFIWQAIRDAISAAGVVA